MEVTVGSDDGTDQPSPDVLEHGKEPTRLSEWSGRRVARGTAAGLLVLGVLGWAVAGPRGSQPSSPDGDARQPAARTVSGGSQAGPALPPRGARVGDGEGEQECESKPGDPATAGRPAGLASARSHALVEAVRRFAAAPRPQADVPWAPRVRLLTDAQGAASRSVSAAVAGRPATWMSPTYQLAGLASARTDRLRIDDEHHVTCRGSPRMQVTGFEESDWVSVQPRVSATSCRGWWAVDLYLDERGRIEAVLVRSFGDPNGLARTTP